MHLKYDYNNKNKPKGYAPDILKKLGITWTHSLPQSISDSFWFFYCKNIPDELPEYISELPPGNIEEYFTEEEIKMMERGIPIKGCGGG